MIRIFLKWLFECFDYKYTDLAVRVTLNISHRNRIKEVEKYWSDVTRIPLVNFRRPFLQNVEWKKVYKNPNKYFGVLRIKLSKSKDFLRKIHRYVEGLRLQAV